MEPTPAVINSLLRACVAAGDLPRAVRAFEEAAVVGAGPDDIAVADSSSVSVLVEGYAATGDVAAAASMLDLGRDLGIEIAESTVVLLIKSLVNAGDVEAATAHPRRHPPSKNAHRLDEDAAYAPTRLRPCTPTFLRLSAPS